MEGQEGPEGRERGTNSNVDPPPVLPVVTIYNCYNVTLFRGLTYCQICTKFSASVAERVLIQNILTQEIF